MSSDPADEAQNTATFFISIYSLKTEALLPDEKGFVSFNCAAILILCSLAKGRQE
jgi:hypothetical protein